MLLSCLLQCRSAVFPRTSEVSFGEYRARYPLPLPAFSNRSLRPIHLCICMTSGPQWELKCEQQQSLEQVPCELTPWTLGYFPKVSKPLVQVKGMRITDPHRNITRMGYMSIKQQQFFLLNEANIMQNRKLYSINGTKIFLMYHF